MRERHNNILERLAKAIPPDLEDKFKEQKLMGFPSDLRSDNSQQRLRGSHYNRNSDACPYN